MMMMMKMTTMKRKIPKLPKKKTELSHTMQLLRNLALQLQQLLLQCLLLQLQIIKLQVE